MIGIEYDRNDLLLKKPQGDLEIVVLMADQLRVDHLGLVEALVAVVVLDQSQGCCDCRARSEYGADPIVDQTVWDLDRLLARPALGENLSLAHLLGSLRAPVGPQEWRAPAQRRFHSSFGIAYVAIKLGFIDYNGGLRVNSSLLRMALRD
jgi:hypothetical protein